MNETIRNKKTIITIIIILVGLIISVYGVLNYQTFLSRAGGGDYGNFNVTQVKNGQDVPIYCNDNSCDTESLDVKLQIKDINQLTNQ